MREIKFRAYIYDLTDEDSHPLEIDVRAGKLWDVASINFKDRIAEIMDDDGNVWEYELNSNEIALMQYTGEKDKNGKEIYDGYIVREKYGVEIPMVVTWDDDCSGFRTLGKYDGEQYVGFVKDSCEVVGNIYENPELFNNVAFDKC